MSHIRASTFFYLPLSLLAVASVGPRAWGCSDDARAGFAAIRDLVLQDPAVRDNHFIVNRSFTEYVAEFGGFGGRTSLVDALGRLGRYGHWIDVGCGTCRAVNDFLRDIRHVDLSRPVSNAELEKRDLPRITALMLSDDFSVPPPPTLPKAQERFAETQAELPRFHELRNNAPADRIRVLVGTPVEEIPKPLERIGPADVITDFYGAAAYSGAIDKVFRRYGELLKPGGKAFLFGNWDRIIIRTRSGRVLRFPEYLKLGTGFETHWNDQSLYLTRTNQRISLPPLNFVRYLNMDRPPPFRYYTIDMD